VSGDFLVQLAAGITSGNRSRVSDVSARILARMSVSVSVSLNAGLTQKEVAFMSDPAPLRAVPDPT